jgi:hypothetical protein
MLDRFSIWRDLRLLAFMTKIGMPPLDRMLPT